MGNVTIYQFTDYDIANDQTRKSRRWGTREAIEARKCHVLEATAVEVDESFVATDEPGLTTRDFDPLAFNRHGTMR